VDHVYGPVDQEREREREREEGETGGRDGSYARLGHGPGWEGEVGTREGEDLAGFDLGSERERGSLAFLIFCKFI